jgi:hypothetical protein
MAIAAPAPRAPAAIAASSLVNCMGKSVVHHDGSPRRFTTTVHYDGSPRLFFTTVHHDGSPRLFFTRVLHNVPHVGPC